MLGPPAPVAPAAEKPVEADPSKVRDGTYSGSAKGMEGQLKVSVTVKAGKITEVKVTEHHETKSRSGVRKALAEVPAKIVEKNGLAVDAVTGATVTSKAIREAVAAALKAAPKN
ncbi:MAG: FMN-binding protein [Planctomycetota bacterium]